MIRHINAFDEIASFMASGMDPERLIAYEIPVSLIERYEVLVEKEKMRKSPLKKKGN